MNKRLLAALVAVGAIHVSSSALAKWGWYGTENNNATDQAEWRGPGRGMRGGMGYGGKSWHMMSDEELDAHLETMMERKANMPCEQIARHWEQKEVRSAEEMAARKIKWFKHKIDMIEASKDRCASELSEEIQEKMDAFIEAKKALIEALEDLD